MSSPVFVHRGVDNIAIQEYEHIARVIFMRVRTSVNALNDGLFALSSSILNAAIG